MSAVYFPTVTPFYPDRFCRPDVFKAGTRIIVLEKDSCTYRAASQFLEQGNLTGRDVALEEVPSFNEAVDFLRRGCGELMLVPFVHSVCRTLRTTEFNHVVDQDFALDNPPIYLATKKPLQAASEIKDRRVAAIKPTDEFLGNSFFEVVPVSSTQEAARLAGEGAIPFCITNEAGVRKHDLRIVRELSHFPMWWQFYKLAN